ncbi:cysteine desulfurase family protein [Helcococcus kunzii]|uniref:cysteine desulfurase family protein n=1 Tax=Helcococcus kunzii TaxID=40091 RepID=UPI0024ADA9C6|nr:cysteine desulfurase family protein [Helcococcus kunzii]
MTYLDYASTSMKRSNVLNNLINKIENFEGNPSSTHRLGRNANKYLEEARSIIAEEIGAKSDNIFFTSGASESNNTVIDNFNNANFEIISSNIEHKSILEPLKRNKSKVIFLEVGKDGKVSLEDVRENINENTKLVSLIYVNNETGVIQPIKEIGQFLKDKDIWFHVDAVQALGHVDIDVNEIKCDSMSLSGHKIGGLNGFGVLYLRKNLNPLIAGGNQEHGQRAGTSNLLAALSMAHSIEYMKSEKDYITEIKKYFLDKLKNIPHEINGDLECTSNHIVNVYFPFAKSDLLLTYLDMNDIYVSAGSACLAGSLEPSYVIEAMYDKERAKKSVRFSFGFTNTKEDIDKVIETLEMFYNRKSKL